ncbi:MAG TPA: sugar transferase [Candidatus Paceibacterota bacterium]|nr:sugar transferase [Candidatus Paceibacterota bacterium]
MTLVPRREYIALLVGDLIVFTLALWLTLLVRYLTFPTPEFFRLHLVPFSLLFIVWTAVFFIAGLYGRYTRLFRRKLMGILLYTQSVNIIIAALFFFLIPAFGIAPKTLLVLYLIVSSLLILSWRIYFFPQLRTTRRLKGVLIAAGTDGMALVQEVKHDGRFPFVFDYVVDTATAPSHEVIQQACRVAQKDDVSFLVVDFFDPATAAVLPIMYDAAFRKQRFALIDVIDLYQEMFDRVPLSLIRYEWILRHVSASRVYDAMKRVFDIILALTAGIASLIIYPFVALAIRLDDGGNVFITQERVGRFQKPIRIIKFRTMSGNDNGVYDQTGKSTLKVTRVGRWLRLLRIDELPQLWNVVSGELSLVGPRPELPALAAQYSARIPYYNARYLVSPGLTGWAQIRHDRDPHHGADVAETKMKLSYDLYYLKRRSFLLDLFIMLQTVRIVLTARGS